MTNLDTFLRQSIGFNRLIDAAGIAASTSNFPPFNIEQIGEHQYRLTLAVAGFKKNDISIDIENGILTIESNRDQEDAGDDVNFIHVGIAARDFHKSWRLGDYVEVTGAELFDGLLVVSLERIIPDALKFRRVEIK